MLRLQVPSARQNSLFTWLEHLDLDIGDSADGPTLQQQNFEPADSDADAVWHVVLCCVRGLAGSCVLLLACPAACGKSGHVKSYMHVVVGTIKN